MVIVWCFHAISINCNRHGLMYPCKVLKTFIDNICTCKKVDFCLTFYSFITPLAINNLILSRIEIIVLHINSKALLGYLSNDNFHVIFLKLIWRIHDLANIIVNCKSLTLGSNYLFLSTMLGHFSIFHRLLIKDSDEFISSRSWKEIWDGINLLKLSLNKIYFHSKKWDLATSYLDIMWSPFPTWYTMS